MSARVVEWRAARFSDPVARLQFLQRVRASPRRATGRSSLLVVTLGLAFASAALVQPVWRHAPTPTPHFTATLHLSQNPPQKPEAAPGRVWMVEANERFELYSNGLQVQNQFVTGTQLDFIH